MSKDANAEKRYIPPGSCTWCGHKIHDDNACRSKIRVQRHKAEAERDVPCPCGRAKAGTP